MSTGTAVAFVVISLVGLVISYWLLFVIIRAAVAAALKRVLAGQHEALIHQNGLIVKSLSAQTDLLKAIAAGGPDAVA